MINIFALYLVLTSLVTACVWSPTAPDHNKKDEVIVKEGHRVVVVEYVKKGDGNTKILISPSVDPVRVSHKPPTVIDAEEKLSDVATATKEKFKDISSGLPNSQDIDNGYQHGPSSNCKHKIASAFGKTKEKVNKKAHEVSEKMCDIEEEAKTVVRETFDKLKNPIVTHKTHMQEVGETGKEAISHRVRDIGKGTKDAAENIIDTNKNIGEDIAGNVSAVKKEAVESVKTGKEKVKEEGQKELNEILVQGKDVIEYVVSLEMINSLMDVVYLLGFCTAYGMCVWVTFVSSYVLSGALPKHQFGMVQSKIYPIYFRAMAYVVGVTLAGYLIREKKRVFSNTVEMFQGCNLLVSLLMIFANLLYLEPRATKVMFEKIKMEKEEGRGRDGFIDEPNNNKESDPASATKGGSAAAAARMNEMLKKLNTYSSFLNVLSLMALSWHLVYLAQRLHFTV